ncbi:MAG: cbb3-type cytochrome c oxidase N-terminal domain-containing protein [Bacteroidia bacterium]
MKQNIKKIILSCLAISLPMILMAQETNPATNGEKTFSMDFNWILLSIAFVLLIPIYITGKAFLFALKENIKRNETKSNSIKKAGIIIFLLGLGHASQAQTFNTVDFPIEWLSWILAGVICFETLLIVIFSIQTIRFLKPEVLEEEKTALVTEKSKNWFEKFWDKINSFKPMSEEANIDTGHSYDGIRELDNVTPPWFITGFLLSILFAGVYLYRYHIGKTAPLQIEEYNIEMAQAEKSKSKLLATKADNVDESNVKMLGASDIEIGKKLFATSCAACHGASGGSMPGGVGPNLTDEYWIHGGSINDIFKSIKYGWPDKGMIAWQNNFSPKQMAQITSFIKSIQDTRPPGAKEPQGEIHKESDKVTKDSITTK